MLSPAVISALGLLARALRVNTKACSGKPISEACPVEATTLGYNPNLGANIFFVVSFSLCVVGSLSLGLWKRTWTFCAAMVLGTVAEVVGYIGRILLHDDVWNRGAFTMQITCIILRPTFICAGIYLTLKHVALALHPGLSRMPAAWYPRVFLPTDISCLVVQALGGGLAAAGASQNDPSLSEKGNSAIMAGVALQVVVLVAFGVMAIDYLFRVSRYVKMPDANDTKLRTWNNSEFRQFGYAMFSAYAFVLIRCVYREGLTPFSISCLGIESPLAYSFNIYRIVETEGGWGNHIMQHESSFMVQDGGLVLLAAILVTVVHPGLFFPPMCSGKAQATTYSDTDKNEALSSGAMLENV